MFSLKQRTSIFLIGSFLALSASQAQQTNSVNTAAPAITGSWQSEGLENYGNHFATRNFTIGEREWQVTYRAYGDAQGKQALFTIRVNGYYVLGEASAKVAGALEGIFPARSRSITAESEPGVQMFAHMGCQLQQGQEKFLVNSGCGFVPGVMQVMGEYDLAALKGEKLFFGDRAGDLSKARPDMLTPYPLARVR